jgi:serine/threonine-protein kinase
VDREPATDELPTVVGDEVQPGRIVAGRYRLIEALASGARASVWKARHLGTGQPLAIKALAASASGEDPAALQRFFQEARATSRLRHPSTVRVYDFGREPSGLVYLAMELLSGRTLADELAARGAITEREALEVAIAASRSLGEAHLTGLVHRDLRPSNIFFHRVPGEVEPAIKVLDFGLAKVLGTSLTRTGDRALRGDARYMSPEQAESRPLDGRSDLYSLGVILFEAVSGEVPFEGGSALTTLELQIRGVAPKVGERARTPVSAAFVALVDRALAKDPERRFRDAAELRRAAEAVASAAAAAAEQTRGAVDPADAPHPAAADPPHASSPPSTPSATSALESEGGHPALIMAQVAMAGGPASSDDPNSTWLPETLLARTSRAEPALASTPPSPLEKRPTLLLLAGAVVISVVLGLFSLRSGPRKEAKSASPPPARASLSLARPSSTAAPARALDPVPVQVDSLEPRPAVKPLPPPREGRDTWHEPDPFAARRKKG